MAARARISGSSRRDFPVAKNRSVSLEAKEQITRTDYKQCVYGGQKRGAAAVPWRCSRVRFNVGRFGLRIGRRSEEAALRRLT